MDHRKLERELVDYFRMKGSKPEKQMEVPGVSCKFVGDWVVSAGVLNITDLARELADSRAVRELAEDLLDHGVISTIVV